MWCMFWLVVGLGYPQCWENRQYDDGTNPCFAIDDAIGYSPECHALHGNCPKGYILNGARQCVFVEWLPHCPADGCCFDDFGDEASCEGVEL